jgi:hypothetical protein
MGKPCQSRLAKFGDEGKRGKVKTFFFSRYAPLIYFVISKCKNIFRSALKLRLVSLKLITFQYIPLFKLEKYIKITFFQVFQDQHFKM